MGTAKPPRSEHTLPLHHSCLEGLSHYLFIVVLAQPLTERPSRVPAHSATPLLQCGGVPNLGCPRSAQGQESHSGAGVMVVFLTQRQISCRSTRLFLSLLRAILFLISRNCIGTEALASNNLLEQNQTSSQIKKAAEQIELRFSGRWRHTHSRLESTLFVWSF